MVNPVRTLPSSEVFVSLFLSLLFIGQLATGTSPLFAIGVLVFASLAYFTFRQAGGWSSLFGICIALFSLQQVVVSQVAKVLYGQAADDVLFQPYYTIAVYDLSIFGILAGTYIVKKLPISRYEPKIKAETDPQFLLRAAYIATALAVIQLIASHILGRDSVSGDLNTGGALGPLRQLTFLPYLSVAICTAFAIISSQGRRSTFILSYVSIGALSLAGLLVSVREEIVAPFIVWFITCLAFKFKFSRAHWSVIIASALFVQFIVSPWALYARGFARTPDISRNIELGANAFIDVLEDPIYYQNVSYIKDSWVDPAAKHYWYYGKHSSVLERFSVICFADGIVDATINYGTVGWQTIAQVVDLLTPHFLNPNKQVTTVQNLLAHRTPGLVGKDDKDTGIALGFSCDAFSSFGWFGIPIITCLLTVLLFGGLRYFINLKLYRNVWVLAYVTDLPWKYSDSNIAELIYQSTAGTLIYAASISLIIYLAKQKSLIPLPKDVANQRQLTSRTLQPLRAYLMKIGTS